MLTKKLIMIMVPLIIRTAISTTPLIIALTISHGDSSNCNNDNNDDNNNDNNNNNNNLFNINFNCYSVI